MQVVPPGKDQMGFDREMNQTHSAVAAVQLSRAMKPPSDHRVLQQSSRKSTRSQHHTWDSV